MIKNFTILILSLTMAAALAYGIRAIVTAETPRQYGCVEQEYKVSEFDGEAYLYTYVWYRDRIANCERDKASEAMEEPRRLEGLEILKGLKSCSQTP